MAKTIRREKPEDKVTPPRAVRKREWKRDRQTWKAYARGVIDR